MTKPDRPTRLNETTQAKNGLMATVQKAANDGDKDAAAWLRGEGSIVTFARNGEYFSSFVRFDAGIHQRDRHTPEYRQWRKGVFQRDKHTCQDCNAAGGRLQAHHLKGWADHPTMRFEIDNGLTLCEGCHAKIHPWIKQRNQVIL